MSSAAESEVESLKTTRASDGSGEVSYEVEGDALSNSLKNLEALRIENVTAGSIVSFGSGADGPNLAVVAVIEVEPCSYIVDRRSFITQNILDRLTVGACRSRSKIYCIA